MRPREGPGLAKGYYLQRPESSLRAHGDRKEENYPQGDEGEKMKEVGQECSHLVRKNLGNRERQEPAGVIISPQCKEKEGKGNEAFTTSQEKEETGKRELAAGPKALLPILKAPGPLVLPPPPTPYSPQGQPP